MNAAADDRRHRDAVAILLLGVVAVGLAVWSAWATLTLTDLGVVVLLPMVPHLVIGGIGAFLVLRTDARRLGRLLAGSVVFISSWGGAATFDATGAGWAGVVGALSGAWLTLLVLAIVGHIAVVGVLPVLGVGGVTVVTSLVPAQDRLAVASSTVAVVALFDPLRREVVDAVDRRDVRDVTDPDEVREHIDAVLVRTVAPASVAVWQPTTEVPS